MKIETIVGKNTRESTKSVFFPVKNNQTPGYGKKKENFPPFSKRQYFLKLKNIKGILMLRLINNTQISFTKFYIRFEIIF